MRFAVSAHRRQELEELVTVLETVSRFENGIGDRINSAPDKEKFICQIVNERSVLRDRLREVLRVCPDPFYDIYDGTFFSQYDLLAHSGGLFIHPWAIETPVGVLSDLVRISRGCLSA